MPNLRSKTWTTTTPANVEDAQYWEDHLISDAAAAKAASSVQTVNNTAPDANGNVDVVALPSGGTTGQVLTKQSSTAGDADWEDPASSGHVIQNPSGNNMPSQGTLQFLHAEVTNDSVNAKTVVDCQGEKGDKGDAATVAVGTVTTLPAGSSATVTNSGTSSAAVFDFGIPKGADGTGAVLSVNGQTGTVVLDASDVGALPDSTVIPDAQIQSDWNQSDNTKKDFIKNKPTIPAAQVNSDWNASSGVAEILNKPTIPVVNNGTLTIQKNGTTVETFTANSNTDKTANIITDTWTSASTADSNMNVVFDNLDNSYGYDLYCEDLLVNIVSMTKGTGTSSGIKLTYVVSGSDILAGTTQFFLRILK